MRLVKERIIAAQDQTLSTNNMRKKVFSENVSPMCWLYGGKEETVTHIVSACPKLVQIKFVGLSHTNKKKVRKQSVRYYSCREENWKVSGDCPIVSI